MKTRHKLLITFSIVHILLVACGAASLLKGPPPNPVVETVHAYSKLSGADNGYGFFAPNVGAQFRTVFLIKDANGRESMRDLKLGSTSEANLRFTGISSQIVSLPPGPRHRLLQSFAAMMFGRNPDATTVTVRLEIYGFDRSREVADFPTMAEYRSGVRPEWLPILDATFTRNDLEPNIVATGTSRTKTSLKVTSGATN